MEKAASRTEQTDEIYAQAMEIIEAEWQDAGISAKQREDSRTLTVVFDRLMGSGCSQEIVRAAWEANYPDTLSLSLRLLAIAERALPAEDAILALLLQSLAGEYRTLGNYASAEAFYARLLALRERTLGPAHPLTRETQQEYAALLREAGREDALLLAAA